MSEGEQDELTAQLVDVIAMCKTTPEPIQAILNLAEFLDHSEKVGLYRVFVGVDNILSGSKKVYYLVS